VDLWAALLMDLQL
jgi:filamin